LHGLPHTSHLRCEAASAIIFGSRFWHLNIWLHPLAICLNAITDGADEYGPILCHVALSWFVLSHSWSPALRAS
jgi:hypothetical protein